MLSRWMNRNIRLCVYACVYMSVCMETSVWVGGGRESIQPSLKWFHMVILSFGFGSRFQRSRFLPEFINSQVALQKNMYVFIMVGCAFAVEAGAISKNHLTLPTLGESILIGYRYCKRPWLYQQCHAATKYWVVNQISVLLCLRPFITLHHFDESTIH